MDEKYRGLKKQLSVLCGVPASRLLLVDVYGTLVRVCHLLLTNLSYIQSTVNRDYVHGCVSGRFLTELRPVECLETIYLSGCLCGVPYQRY